MQFVDCRKSNRNTQGNEGTPGHRMQQQEGEQRKF